jgi:hypothetical protein
MCHSKTKPFSVIKGSSKLNLRKHLEECVPDYEEIYNNRAKPVGPFSEADQRYHIYTHSVNPYNILRPCSGIRSIAMAFSTLDEKVNFIDIFIFKLFRI